MLQDLSSQEYGPWIEGSGIRMDLHPNVQHHVACSKAASSSLCSKIDSKEVQSWPM